MPLSCQSKIYNKLDNWPNTCPCWNDNKTGNNVNFNVDQGLDKGIKNRRLNCCLNTMKIRYT